MTAQHARVVANVTLATAGLAAAYVIVTTPPLRRFILRAARRYVGPSVSLYLARQAKDAWAHSKHPAEHPAS